MSRSAIVVMFLLKVLACNLPEGRQQSSAATGVTIQPPMVYNHLTKDDLNYIDLMIPHDDADVFIIYPHGVTEGYVNELITLFEQKSATIHATTVPEVTFPDTNARTKNLYIHYMGDYRYEIKVLNL